MGHAVPACSPVTVTLSLEETTGHVKRKIAKQPTGPIIWSTWFNNCFCIGWNLPFFLLAACPSVHCLYNCRLCTITIYIKLFPTRLDFSYFSFMYIFGCWLNAVTMVHSYAISCPINQWRRWAWRQQKTMNKLHLWKVLNNANTAADNRTYKKDYLCQKRKEFHNHWF